MAPLRAPEPQAASAARRPRKATATPAAVRPASERREAVGPAFGGVELRPLASLIPYAKNARLHDVAQMESLRASMREYGWTIPVLIDEQGGVIAGHARLAAAADLGIPEVPVLVAKGWSDAKKRAYVLADNSLTERGGWNWELVAAELTDLQALGSDLTLTGFEEYQFAPLLAGEWVPPDPKQEGSKGPHDAADKATISVTTEQLETIMLAVERERERAEKPSMSTGRALELIAERTLKPDEPQSA
jgi:hypothetical protein